MGRRQYFPIFVRHIYRKELGEHMKRKIALLLVMLAMCCAYSHALAEFDLTPYMYEENTVIPFNRNTQLILTSDNTAHRVRLEQNGAVIQEVTMEKNGNRLNVVLGEEGNIGLITRPDLAGGQAKQLYYCWNENNMLSEPVKLSDSAGFLYACGNGFYGADRKENLMEVFVRNDEGREVFSRAYMCGVDIYISPMECIRNADGTYLLAVCKEHLDTNEQAILVERISADGMVIWQTEFPGRYGHDGCVLSDDGYGGAYLTKTDDDNYKLEQVYRIGTDGRMLWTKRLEAEGLVLHAFCGAYDETADGLVIDGSVVSKSKGVYKVIRLEVSGNGQIVSASAKDFSSRPDYGFKVLRAVDGSVFAESGTNYLDTKNTKHVLVPVDMLPEASVPVLTLE